MEFILNEKLSEIYKLLNNKSISSFYNLNLELKQKIKDFISTLEKDNEITFSLLIELDIIDLRLAIDDLIDFDIKLLPFYSRNSNYVEYLEKRINETTNPFILSRYFHLLWLVKKHNKYAVESIKYYLKARDISLTEKGENWALDLLECLKRSFFIRSIIKKEADSFNIEQDIICTILTNINNDWGYCICLRLLDVILLSHRQFKLFLNYDFLDNLNMYAIKLISSKESYKAINLLQAIIKISEKMNIDTTKMYENLGAANEARINELNKSFAGVSFCLEAIKIYNRLQNNQKVIELKCIYEEITSTMKFGEIKKR